MHRFAIVPILILAGCAKPPNNGIGGLGGKATLIVTPIHLELNVDSCKIYLKYNSLDAPADGKYDDSQAVHMRDTTPVVIFTGLKNGNYYLFGNGYHAFYHVDVQGGIGITLQAQDSNFILLPTAQY